MCEFLDGLSDNREPGDATLKVARDRKRLHEFLVGLSDNRELRDATQDNKVQEVYK